MARTSKDGVERRRMTESEGAALVQEWRQSGLAMSEFSRVRGVGAHRVRYWDQRLARSAPGSAATQSFVVMSATEVEGEISSKDRLADDAIEIVVGDRFFVRVPACAGSLAEVLQALRDADR